MIAWDPIYAHPLPEGHRFPMEKYHLIPDQLLHHGIIKENQIFSPTPCPDEIICRVHDPFYLQKLHQQTLTAKEQRAIGFPQSPALTLRELIITQGTIDCAKFALEFGVALNVAGGTHHAFSNRGEGFCLLNDFAVAAQYILDQKWVQKILIVDLDVHQGNGTAAIFQNHPQVFTFSMHGAKNYPFHKEVSDLDVALEDGTDSHTYLQLLEKHLPVLLEQEKPDFVFYLSGVDILETDRFGKLKVTKEGCKQRDVFVLQELRKRNLPCAISMGGGYSPSVKDIVEAHCATFEVAQEIYALY